MKWVFYVLVFVYMAYRAVYGAKVGYEISIEKIDYGNSSFFVEGTRQMINCRASSRNQRLEWVDPLGKVIARAPTNRVFTQEHLVANPYGLRTPALALVFERLLAKDTGVYKCRSGKSVQQVPLCVIKPAEFINTPTEVTATLGRAITLTCQAKGDPEPNLIWTRGLEDISETNDTSKYKVNTKYNSQGFESLLTITSLVPEDSGQYSCESIQKQSLDECVGSNQLNITLLVSHSPVFKNGNNSIPVYGKINDIVDLVCSASAYPAPTYRWFKVEDGDTLAEFDEKQIKYSEEENQAILSVKASPTTFGRTYKCVATNADGDAEKYFNIYKMVKPDKPGEVIFAGATGSQITLFIEWTSKIDFPVEGFHVQYLKMKRKPKDSEWRRAKEVFAPLDEEIFAQVVGQQITIDDLEEATNYWLRVRPTNGAGDGPWSDPTLAETDIKEEEPEESETDDSEDEPVASGMTADGAFYGIFFAGGIAVVAVVCMFVMRMV